MRIGTNDQVWAVIDPTPLSTLLDIVWQTTIAGLAKQAVASLYFERRRLTIYTEYEEALADARARLAMRDAGKQARHRPIQFCDGTRRHG